jgi:hypothetical protein
VAAQLSDSSSDSNETQCPLVLQDQGPYRTSSSSRRRRANNTHLQLIQVLPLLGLSMGRLQLVLLL